MRYPDEGLKRHSVTEETVHGGQVMPQSRAAALAYLKRLPVEQIKIDRSFVRDISHDPSDEVIVRTIIVMSNTLGMKVIAEGVETQDQRDILARNGCYTYQGYLFGKPLPIEDFLKHQVLTRP